MKNDNEINENIEKNENTEKIENTQNTEKQNTPKAPKQKNKLLKIIGRILNVIIWILLVAIMLILLLTVISKKTEIFGHRLYIIMSGSMEPTIMTEDAIITKNIDNPQEGDIIAFENGDMITVHRIVQVQSQGDKKLYQTKGDNNNTVDKGFIGQSQIKGKVVCTIPRLGKIILFIQSHVLILILAIGIISISIIVRRLIFSE